MNNKYVFLISKNHDNENLTKNRPNKIKKVYPAQKHIYVKMGMFSDSSCILYAYIILFKGMLRVYEIRLS